MGQKKTGIGVLFTGEIRNFILMGTSSRKRKNSEEGEKNSSSDVCEQVQSLTVMRASKHR